MISSWRLVCAQRLPSLPISASYSCLQRDDLLAHHGAHLLDQRFDLVGHAEVHAISSVPLIDVVNGLIGN